MGWLSLSFLGVCLLEGALGYSMGAPDAACNSLTPGHGPDPLSVSTAPYRVSVSADRVKLGERLSVRLSGVDGTEFQGFLIQARNASDDAVSGTFFTHQHNYLTCGRGHNNAVTHKSASRKKEIIVDWEPTSGTSGGIRFKATFVQKYDTFWVGVESLPVRVERSVPDPEYPGKPIASDPGTAEVPVGNVDSTARPRPAQTQTPRRPSQDTRPRVPEAGSSRVPPGQEGGRNEAVGKDPIYDGCDASKGCFGSPGECVKDGNCDHMVTWRKKGSRFLFEVQAMTDGYVALGLSMDKKMGDDAVVECMEVDGRIKAYRSWNSASPRKGNKRADDHSGIHNVNGAYVNGIMSCSFELDPIHEQNGVTFDLDKQKYSLFVAAGPVKEDKSNVAYHRNGRIMTGSPVALGDFSSSKIFEDRNLIPHEPEVGSSREPQGQDGGRKEDRQNRDPIYDGCQVEKGCFGKTEKCVADGDCSHIVAWRKKGDRFLFELQAKTDGYVAMGLSMDSEMGDDAVVECMEVDGRIKAYRSWNAKVPGKGNTRAEDQSGIYNVKGAYVNGVFYCSFELDPVHEQNGIEFNLDQKEYVVLVAAGYVNEDKSNIGYHSNGRIAAGSPVALASTVELKAYDPILLRLHGAFMLGAWICAASCGMLLARYYKNTWVGSQICGKDLWFVWHRFFMVITWSLTVAGFVLIFVELKGWTYIDIWRNPHSVLGVVTTGLCFIQPFMAIFRPHPGTSKRPIFNWAHWFVGNSAQIIGIVAIFFAVKLQKAELPQWMDWILVAFVAFHGLMHFMLSIHMCWSEGRFKERNDTYAMKEMGVGHNSLYAERKRDAPGSGLRKWMLGIYLLINWLFTALLILIVVLAPAEVTLQKWGLIA